MKKNPRSKASASSLNLTKERLKNLSVRTDVRAGRMCCMSSTRSASYAG